MVDLGWLLSFHGVFLHQEGKTRRVLKGGAIEQSMWVHQWVRAAECTRIYGVLYCLNGSSMLRRRVTWRGNRSGSTPLVQYTMDNWEG